MTTTKSIDSDSAPSVSGFFRRVATTVFPSLGREDSLTDESSEEDDHPLTNTFDPVEFHKDTDFFRTTSSNTALTENDSAWFCTASSMEDCVDDRSTLPWRDEPNGGAPQSFSNSDQAMERKIQSRRNFKRRRKRRHAKHQLCDSTTIALAVLCIVLTLILGILFLVLDPTFQTNNSIDNNSNGIVSETTNNTFAIPTMKPVITSIPTISPVTNPVISTTERPTSKPVSTPTRWPTKRPISTPTAQPTVLVPAPVAIGSGLSNLLPFVASKDNVDQNEVPPLSMGPMVGHTTHDSVTLWAYHEFTNDAIEVILYDYDTHVLLRKINFDAPRSDRNHAFLETIRDLQPSTSYKFGMHIRGERVGKGSFTTAPLPNSSNGTQFDYILASCMNYRQYSNQMVWDVIVNKLGKYPDFSILAGDTVYLQEGTDVTDENGVNFDRLWLRNQEQRKEPHFAKFIENVPTYSTWNDHEYGTNNADMDQKGKLNSLKAWESLWPNPGYGDETTDDGVYYSYYWGDVHYIVTDDHWYRDSAQGNRLGAKQTQWIENELLNSKGTFKVIVIGSDIMERTWTSDLNNIGDIVRENRINGVVFHAGDIHRNEYKEMITGGFPYPVKQITSSGIAKVWRRPFVHIQVNTQLDDPSMTAFFYGASSTADVTTWTNDPSLVCSSVQGIDRAKEHSCTETIRLSDLTVPSI